MKLYHYLYISTAILIASCAKTEDKVVQVSSPADYEASLSTATTKNYTNAVAERDFWSNKMSDDTTGVGSLGSLAAAYSSIFAITGNSNNLYRAEKLYKKGIINSAHNKDGFTRSLAHNYISQHRFKEAKEILEESYNGISNKKATEFVLFDVYMELGQYEDAYKMLELIKNNSDYNYLIRVAKWSDYKGDLDSAIRYLEQAREIADARKSKSLQIWTYTNLGDYYGHAGRIQDAYTEYLKTLRLDPENAYAKKGIAWIVYSAEKNTAAANKILDSIMVHHNVPDYYLLKAEMAEYENNEAESKKYTNQFLNAVQQGNYGAQYNDYLIEVYADKNPIKSLEMAEAEVGNRATPESYHLLALAQLKNNKEQAALQTIKDHVEGKTSEPMALYHSALVYKANNDKEKVKMLKSELLEAEFEVGPVLFKKIQKL
ncbi:tetratricopeptide repeat protein [Rasiella sp. SM2506]|uniref:tetratricopeptide repeat protein n=1 Tax=Rasiella sp. SM2506 TaxID=3423914 RepID=UPI003D7B2981